MTKITNGILIAKETPKKLSSKALKKCGDKPSNNLLSSSIDIIQNHNSIIELCIENRTLKDRNNRLRTELNNTLDNLNRWQDKVIELQEELRRINKEQIELNYLKIVR